MDSDSDNVAETEKYAFLLGSALRNEDTEQFFSVYDSILPGDLPDGQVVYIKDKAREIAELPEEQFNSLVSRALHFSLAPAGKTMTYRPAPGSRDWSFHSDDEDEGVGRSTGRHGVKSETSSQYSFNTTKVSARSSESDARRFEEDSGVCNSSKATNSIGSLSDHDASDSEERLHFDYFPQGPQVKIRSGCGLFVDYDEAHDVQSDRSSQDVNSPRSEISDLGQEMETFHLSAHDEFPTRQFEPDDKDFFTDEDSDEDNYKSLYQGYQRYDTSSRDSGKLKFESSKDSWSTSGLRSKVDDGINFSSLSFSRYSHYDKTYGGSSSSDKVKIEQNTYHKPTSQHKHEPPFGRGPDQLNKVGSSITSLIENFPGGEVKNMPAARKLEPLKSEDTKKKRKKKRGKDDPLDKYEKGPERISSSYDENGNPLENQPINRTSYMQMRDSPAAGLGGVNSGSKIRSYGTTDNHHELQSFRSDNYNKDLENGTSKSHETGRKPRKKVSKEKVERAEDVNNYVGDKKSIDELVDFIDGGNNVASRKTKKLLHTNSEDIPDKSVKASKKSKDKKQKPSVSSTSVEERDKKGENSVHTTSIVQECGENMGNSGAKSDCNTEGIAENGDVEDIFTQDEELKNSLLKDAENKKKLQHHVNSFHANSIKTVSAKEGSRADSIRKESPSDPSVTSTENKRKLGRNGKATTKNDKSETAVQNSKADPVTNMTVRQKNVKNLKSKPSSPITKEEHSSIPTVAVTQEEKQIFHSITNSSLDGDFIFTDIDVPIVPKEDEFRQVIGKKKKKSTKDVPQNHYVSNNVANNKPFSRGHEEKRSVSRNFNKISSNYAAAIPAAVTSDTRMRDLSPSAFPALGNAKSKQSCQEGRRNSTGDVPIPSEVTVKSQDDSDIESVKSLPATQGGQSDSLLSPRLNMSYAKMAASPKPLGSSSSPGKESPVEIHLEEIERKVPVFKGSPTERRHSIGSSPNGKHKVSEPMSPSLCLKSGSQEVLTVEPGTSQSDCNVSVTLGAQESDIVCKPSKSSSCVREDIKQMEKDVNLTVNHKLTDVVSNPLLQSLSQQVPVKTLQSSDGTDSKHSSFIDNREPNEQKPLVDTRNSRIVAHKHELPKGASKPLLSATTNNKKLKQKSSVIFCGNYAATEDLGITFGFDGSDAGAEKMVLDMSNQSVQNCSSDCPKGNAQCEDTVVTFSGDVDLLISQSSLSHSVIPDTSTSDHNSTTRPSLASPEAPSDLSKKLSHVGKLNGIVSASTHGHTNHSDTQSSYLAKVTTVENTSNSTPVSVNEVPASIEKNDVLRNNLDVVVYFGEEVIKMRNARLGHQPLNGSIQYCGHVNYRPEGEDPRGQFNATDAMNYLWQEWDKVSELKEKEPDLVKYHVE